MQALSHYSFHKSGGQYLLCDLQGGLDDGEGPVLSDPAILSRDMKYGVTDLGSEGIANFFALHRCNKYCRRWSRPRSRHVRQLFSVRRGTTFMGFGDTVGSSASRDTHRVHSRRTRGTVRTLSTQTSDHSHHQHHHGGSQHSHPAHDEAYYVPVEEEDEQSDYGEENVVYYEEEDGDESAAGEDSADSEDATKYDVDADYYYYYQEENTAEDEHEA